MVLVRLSPLLVPPEAAPRCPGGVGVGLGVRHAVPARVMEEGERDLRQKGLHHQRRGHGLAVEQPHLPVAAQQSRLAGGLVLNLRALRSGEVRDEFKGKWGREGCYAGKAVTARGARLNGEGGLGWKRQLTWLPTRQPNLVLKSLIEGRRVCNQLVTA